MKKLPYFLLAIPLTAIFTAPPGVFAQGIDLGRSKEDVPHPADLVFNISIDQMQNRAPAGLSVQLTDPSGGDSMSQPTDNGGRVVFHTTDGVHQFRITGTGIEDYSGTIEIIRQQSRDVENIVVKSKPGSGQFGVAQPGGPSVVSAASLNIPDKAQKEFKAGSKAMEKKDYDEAKKHFLSATEIYDKYSLAYNGMGVAQMDQGDSTAARASFERAVQIDDRFAEAYRNLARLSLAAHNFEESEELLSKSLLSEPLNAWALTYAAYAELQLHNFDAAIAHAREAHGVPHSGLASVHIVAAHALEATNQLSEALKEYQLYLQEDPSGRDAQQAKQAIASLSSAESK